MKEKDEKKVSIKLTKSELFALVEALDSIILSESNNQVFSDIDKKVRKALIRIEKL
jgi:inactivated superfamily I helicase